MERWCAKVAAQVVKTSDITLCSALQYLNLSANICDALLGALCPLPQYQFDGSFAYILPESA